MLRRRLRNALLHGSVITAAGLASSASTALIANLAILGLASPAVYADVAVVTIVVTLLGIALRMGADRMFVGEVHSAGTPRLAKRRGAQLLSGAVLTSCTGGILISLGPGESLLNSALSAPLSASERTFIAIWLAAETLRLVVAEADRADARFIASTLSGNGLRNVLYMTCVILLGLFQEATGRSSIVYAAAAASAIALSTRLSQVTVRYPWWRAKPFGGLVALKRHSIVVLNTIAAAVIGGADVWIVGVHFTTSETAQYALAVALVGSLALVPAAISGGIAPRVAALMARDQWKAVQAYSRPFVMAGTGVVTLALISLVLLFEPIAYSLGGPGYRGIWVFIAILGTGHLLAVAGGIGGWLLIYARRYREATVAVTAISVVAVGVEWSFGTTSDLLLLASASATATAAISIVSNVVTHRVGGIRTDVLAKP